MYKLLIADDESLEREVLRLFVEESGLDVSEIIECVNGTDALTAIVDQKPDILILDIKMPGLSGLELLEQIRSTNRECKIILSTAYSYFNYALKALQLGATEFLVKPVQKELFVRTINKAIDQLDEQRMKQQAAERLQDTAHALERQVLGALLRGAVDEEVLWFLGTKGIQSSTGGCCFFARITPELGPLKTVVEKQLRTGLKEVGFQFVLAVNSTSFSLLVFGQHREAMESILETAETLAMDILFENSVTYTMGKAEWFFSLEEVEHANDLVRSSLGDLVNTTQTVPQSHEVDVDKGMPAEVLTLMHYIEEHFSDKLTLDSLSCKVGFSKFYISRLFKQHIGTTIMDYLIGVRMDRAKTLLVQSEQSIKQISYSIGYSDPNYFTWSFKKYVGVSPVKYRYHESSNAPRSNIL